MDRLDLFRIFTRVVETTSFTRAAASLNLPRSTVSTAIRDLEFRLGTRLLARTTRHVVPTTDGTTFYAQCLRLIADVEEVEGLFRRDGMALHGVVRVDLPGRLGRLVVAPALPDFLDRHPGLEIELGMTDRAINLVEEGADCVVRVGVVQQAGLIARPLPELPVLSVASPAYLARHGVPRVPDDLRAHQAVHYASPSSGRVEPWEWTENAVTQTLDLPGRVTVNSAEGLIACCLAGIGMVQIPAYDAAPLIREGALVEILPDYRPEPLPVTLLYPHRRLLAPRVRSFADWLHRLLLHATGSGAPSDTIPTRQHAGRMLGVFDG
ncbi:LysR family transcriptional regulator [Acidomonas methanolica]|uniref:Transcriptional regulator LysR n=1 Tax=Acidomonas methanolica NBRC 104435 TaxID=1231351 RepID=A0A023D8T3_ACIMT|nr:LysR family transcriptional regulator [Acidomonas methanolica]MBU2655685.1 LysR family transcriptional regulator [Acidomonas methanolica]TCS20466.1 LysR family transcriptional regulator [Acidomonas methanolica]GAJ30582.1 transcriptional regulator LysR [Acidomonas methanolica NBRC 104435]GBQ48899.1 LysR family transcriptional regulator [Acidomonas methanolica]GEL00614.1 LysR family transcriptional regulator [Acidomonas methanolica NBRC 104435]